MRIFLNAPQMGRSAHSFNNVKKKSEIIKMKIIQTDIVAK